MPMRHLPHLIHQPEVILVAAETMVLMVKADEEEAGEADIGKEATRLVAQQQ